MFSIGQPARVASKAARGREVLGEVVRIAPIVDATTGTVKVTIHLPKQDANPGDASRRSFLPGMYAEVTLTTERREDVLVLPKSSLVRRDEEVFAFVVKDDRAVQRALTVGLEDADVVEVLDGVTMDDEIILAGQISLKDGALIQRVDAQGNPIDGEGLEAARPSATEGVASTRSDESDGGS